MVKAWQKWESIEKPRAWVCKVAYRTYLKRVRARDRQAISWDESTYEPAVESELSIFSDGQQVLQMLRALPPGQRTIAACFYDGLTCEEIAELVQKPAATVRSQLRHARKALREMMDQGG